MHDTKRDKDKLELILKKLKNNILIIGGTGLGYHLSRTCIAMEGNKYFFKKPKKKIFKSIILEIRYYKKRFIT